MRSPRLVLALVLVVPVLAAGCSAGDDGDENASPPPATTVATEEEPQTPFETPRELQSLVWERSYSECGTERLPDLARKYKTAAVPQAVAAAVGQRWVDTLGAGADALADGRDGCLQALEQA